MRTHEKPETLKISPFCCYGELVTTELPNYGKACSHGISIYGKILVIELLFMKRGDEKFVRGTKFSFLR